METGEQFLSASGEGRAFFSLNSLVSTTTKSTTRACHLEAHCCFRSAYYISIDHIRMHLLRFSLATKLFIVVVVMLSLSIRGWRSITPPCSLHLSSLRFKATSKLQFVASDAQKPLKKSFGDSNSLRMAWGDRGNDRGNDRNRGGSGGDFRRSGGGGRGGGGSRFGGRGGDRQPYVDPFAKLNFRQTIKIDPESTTTIQAMNMSPLTEKVLIDKGFTVMTPVQSQSYQEVYDGNDVVARSRTGTGKTFAFGLPLIEKIISQGANKLPSSKLPVILILEPTRELAMQVAQELSTVCRPHRLRISAIYGGVPFFKQSEQIANGVHIIVGTPGKSLITLRHFYFVIQLSSLRFYLV